jgi:cytochrome c oxidase cbb3-type subunit III
MPRALRGTPRYATMSEPTDKQQPARRRKPAVQTTGHAWDGDLQEYNNPLPRWWLWSFYASVLAAVLYWFLYPAWPIGQDYTKGLLSVTFQSGEEEVTTHWNTRALLAREMQQGAGAMRQREFLERVGAAEYDEILSDAEMLAFTRAVGRTLFGENCAACHGVGGGGVAGLFPTLADDDWLWGGTVERIEESIARGRNGFMPAFRASFTPQQLDELTEYVLSLSGHGVEEERALRGERIFNGREGGCVYCHGEGGTGYIGRGGPNLTNAIWHIADVPGQPDLDGKRAAVREVIRNGAGRSMPAWEGRLDAAQVKALAVYVHELGGGQ